jgi:hypothetical protein
VGYLGIIAIGLGLCALGFGLDVLVNKRRSARRKMLEEQRVDAARTKKMMEELIETEGWKFISEAAKVQAMSRENEVMLKPTENPLAQEYLKGEVQGIKLFTTLPEKLLEGSKAIIDLAMEEDTR